MGWRRGGASGCGTRGNADVEARSGYEGVEVAHMVRAGQVAGRAGHLRNTCVDMARPDWWCADRPCLGKGRADRLVRARGERRRPRVGKREVRARDIRRR